MPFRDRTDEAKQDKHYKHSSSRIECRWSKEGKLWHGVDIGSVIYLREWYFCG